MPVLSDEEIEARLAELDGWEREGDSLRRVFDRGDFKGAVDFVNRITPVAEEMNHHPDLWITWSKVTVSLSTHSQGGITESDFELASRIDAVV
jgi:4a-hydroxytetrahydrobiopterin dehydratase